MDGLSGGRPLGLHRERRVGIGRGVEVGVPEVEHLPDVGLGLEDARQHDRLVDPERSGAPVGRDRVQVAEVLHPGPGLPRPLQVGGFDGLGGGEQVGNLVRAAADRAPVADVAFGWRLDAVLDAADPGEVLAGRVGHRLPGQPGGLAKLAQPRAEILAGLRDRAMQVGSHGTGWPAPRRC